MEQKTAVAMEARARRAAKRVGLIARKSRWRIGTVDNWGRFLLLEPRYNVVVAGERFELGAEEVLDYCGIVTQIS